MTEQEYNLAEGVRRSDLTKLQRSPAHAKYAMEHPMEPTPALTFGIAVHMAVLEPERFKEQYRVADFDARTKEGKALKQEALDKGITLLNAETFEQISGIVKAINASPYAKRLLTGNHETSHFWTDAETGELCKCRTDCETDIDGTHYIVDLKTCTNASTEAFTRDAMQYGYFVQAAMYTAGVKATTGKESAFVFVAVEKDPPYAVNVLEVGADAYLLGLNGNRKTMGYRSLLELYHRCKEEDRWPGYEGFDDQIEEIQLPRWMTDEKPKADAEPAKADLIGKREVMQILGIGERKFYTLTKQDGFPAVRIGRKTMVERNRLNDWIAKQIDMK